MGSPRKTFFESMKAFLASFYYAGRGIYQTFLTERNFRIHSFAALLAIVLGFIYRLTKGEWLVITVCMVFMLAVELVNTAIEHVCDAVTTTEDNRIKRAKDAAAGACLLVATLCVIAGVVIFTPKVFK